LVTSLRNFGCLPYRVRERRELLYGGGEMSSTNYQAPDNETTKKGESGDGVDQIQPSHQKGVVMSHGGGKRGRKVGPMQSPRPAGCWEQTSSGILEGTLCAQRVRTNVLERARGRKTRTQRPIRPLTMVPPQAFGKRKFATIVGGDTRGTR